MFRTLTLTVIITLFTCACTSSHTQIPPHQTNLEHFISKIDNNHTTFVKECVAGVMIPAKKDYTAAAIKAGNSHPKPFPEEQLSTSVTAMCECLANELDKDDISYADVNSNLQLVSSYINEAFEGGTCRPEGLLGIIVFGNSPKN